MVFRENALVAAFGAGAGLGAALLASRALASFLYSTSPNDPWVQVTSIGALTVIRARLLSCRLYAPRELSQCLRFGVNSG
jgi:hypothetical protein